MFKTAVEDRVTPAIVRKIVEDGMMVGAWYEG
jgi:hypothetical protein